MNPINPIFPGNCIAIGSTGTPFAVLPGDARTFESLADAHRALVRQMQKATAPEDCDHE